MSKRNDIYEHIEELERSSFSESGLENAINDLQICREDRTNSGFDTRYEIGYRILTHDLKHGVKGNRTGEDRVFINFTEENLSHKASELKAADVQISLQNDTNIIPFVQELAEGVLNHTFDYIDILQRTYRAIEDQNFFNWGVCYTGWDGYDRGSGMWIVGKPYVEVCAPNSVYVNPGVHDDLYEDSELIFEEKKYITERAKLLYPKIAEKIVPTPVKFGNEEEKQTSREHTQIIRHQYRKTYVFDQRKIINNEKDVDVGVTDWLEKDYQEYLQERLVEMTESGEFNVLLEDINKMLSDDLTREEVKYSDEIEKVLEKKKKGWEIEFLDLIAQQNFDNLVFEEKIVATQKRRVEYRVWFEVIFCEDLSILLQEPVLKKRCGYAFFPGTRDAKTSYPISQAFKSSKILEMHSAALTLQMLYMVRMGKPQLVIEQGALVNEEEFRKNYHIPSFKPIVDSAWRKRNPRKEPFYFTKPPDLTPAIMAIDRKLEMWIEKQDRSHSVTKGEPSYSGQSGKAIESLQQASKQGDKTDLYKLSHFYKVICENLKDMIMDMLDDVPFKILHLNEQGVEELIDVNTNDDNTISGIADDCYVKVHMSDNVEVMAQKNRSEADFLLTKGLITKIDALRMMNPDNVDKLIKNVKAQDEVLRLMSMIDERPEVREQIMELLQQPQEVQSSEAI